MCSSDLVSTLNSIANKVFPQVATSLKLDEILSLLGNVTKYEIADNAGFPFEEYRGTGTVGSKGSCVVPVSLEKNVKKLHQFLFGTEDYEVSDNVKTYSNSIKSETSAYVKGANADTPEGE